MWPQAVPGEVWRLGIFHLGRAVVDFHHPWHVLGQPHLTTSGRFPIIIIPPFQFPPFQFPPFRFPVNPSLSRSPRSSPPHPRPADPPRNLRLQSFVESSQGAATILLCAVDSHPPARLTLLRGGHPVASSPPGGGDTPRQSLRVSPSPNALRLEFREASEEDEGEYECQARSALGATHASLTLRVQGGERGQILGDTLRGALKGARLGGLSFGGVGDTQPPEIWRKRDQNLSPLPPCSHQGAGATLGRGAGGDRGDLVVPDPSGAAGDPLRVVQERAVGDRGSRALAGAPRPPLRRGALQLQGGPGSPSAPRHPHRAL